MAYATTEIYGVDAKLDTIRQHAGWIGIKVGSTQINLELDEARTLATTILAALAPQTQEAAA